MTVIPVITGALVMILKDLVKRLEVLEVRVQAETIQTTAFKNWPEYREESWRLEKTCCLSDSNERPSADAGVKNSQRE